jgi:hypothetical protein
MGATGRLGRPAEKASLNVAVLCPLPFLLPSPLLRLFRLLFQGGIYSSATGLYPFVAHDCTPVTQQGMEQEPIGFVENHSPNATDQQD